MDDEIICDCDPLYQIGIFGTRLLYLLVRV
jgi:hypothetical protein